MNIRQITAIHISSVSVHDQNEDKRTLLHLPYQMLWHKWNAHVESLYFYIFHICDVLYHQTFCFEHFGFYSSVFSIPITLGYQWWIYTFSRIATFTTTHDLVTRRNLFYLRWQQWTQCRITDNNMTIFIPSISIINIIWITYKAIIYFSYGHLQ